MTTLDIATIERKIESLQEQIDILASFRSQSEKEITNDIRNRYTVERALQLAIEAILDSSRLLVLFEGWSIPKSEPQAVEILAQHAVISEDLKSRCLGAKGFRNILVHEYEKIDSEKVYAYLMEGYDDLQEFASSLAAYLQTKVV